MSLLEEGERQGTEIAAGPEPATRVLALTAAKSATKGSPGLFRVVWRWHFYAGIIVAPVLVIVAITGALYIFRDEVEQLARGHLMFVEPREGTIGVEGCVEAARGALGDEATKLEVAGLELSPGSDRSTVVLFRDASKDEGPRRRRVRVFVDPHEAKVLGVLDSKEDRVASFFETVLLIHRQLFIGTTGRVIVELTTSWTILLLVTGLYLWWPRRKEKVRGVWWPRWRAKPYTVLRDLHAVSGAYTLAIALVIVGTGLWYTYTLGLNFRKAAENWEMGRSIFSKDWPDEARKREEMAARKAKEQGSKEAAVVVGPLPVEAVVATARGFYPDKVLNVTFPAKPEDQIRVLAANDRGAAGQFYASELILDRKDATVHSQTYFAGTSKVRWWSTWNYPLHVGSILGIATKILWLLICFVLAALPITGIWMWWRRRPRGKTGFPRRTDARLPWLLIGLIALLCVVLPMVGVSVVLILLGEGIFRLIRAGWRKFPRPKAA